MNTDPKPAQPEAEDYEIDTLTNDRLLKDHEYDGIRELDNDPPSWFNYLFMGTIAFAILYLYSLFLFRPSELVQEKEFAKAMAAAERSKAAAQQVVTTGDEATAEAPKAFEIALLTDEPSLNSGKQIFANLCAVCHLADGGGLVGPNLTDNYWLHGNTIQDMYKVVTEGIIEKGMVPYEDQLSPKQRLEVSSYILEILVGSTPANPKEPQGEKY